MRICRPSRSRNKKQFVTHGYLAGALRFTAFAALLCLAASCWGDDKSNRANEAIVPPQTLNGEQEPTLCPADLGSGTFSAPIPDTPEGAFGASGGSFDVDSSGQPVWRLPLVLPPGPRGMTPMLSFEYKPGTGQEFMAPGWTLGGLSTIARCPHDFAHGGAIDPVNLTASDHYCLDGKRLVPIGDNGTEIEYRT